MYTTDNITTLHINTTPVKVDDSVYYVKNSLGWWDKGEISSASQLVKAEGELKEQIIKVKQGKGLTYKKKLTEKEQLENQRLFDNDKPAKYFTDKDVLTFVDPQAHTLARLTAYLYRWEIVQKEEGKDEILNVALTPQNIKQIPPHHFQKITKQIMEVESKTQPFQGEPGTKK